jgi:putative MATE family efflux protein
VSSILEGPLRRSVLRVAIPATAFQLLVFANNLVDYLWVKRLGPEAAAGQTAGWTLLWMLLAIAQVFSIGLTAVVARRVGEGRAGEAVHAAGQGVRGALLASLLVGAAGWFAVPLVVENNASGAEASRHALGYLRAACAGAPLVFLFYACEGVFKGRGDMGRPLRAVATALALNIVLDPILIHVARLEVTGAAMATVLAFGITGALLLRAAFRRGWLRLRGAGLDLRLVLRIVRIGTPVSLHGIVFSAVYVFLITEVNRVGGDRATAALGLGARLEGFAYFTSLGFAAAAAAVVGQNLGARNLRRAHDGAWLSVRIAAIASGAWGLLLLVLPFGAIDRTSPGAVTTWFAMDYLAIASASFAFTSVELVLEGAFAGAGDTVPPLLLGLPMTVVRVPAAWAAASLGYGVAGIFWALTFTSVARGLLFALWFARGRWVHAKA